MTPISRGCVKTSMADFCGGTSTIARIEVMRCRPFYAVNF